MDVELQATCSALGYLEGNEYIKEPDCLETVKDLIRFLRRDNDICEIRRQLGHAQILQNDLIPLVKFYHKDKVLFETVIKLLVNLTQPVLTCWNNQIPDEKTLRNYCIEVEGFLQDYKEAFIDEDFFSVLCEKIKDILKLEWDELREDDKLQLERLFVLIRNILMIPPDPHREKCTEDDASTHDRVLWTIHTSGVEDLILYVASSERERNMLCMHVLEIISLMFKEQEAEAIALAGVQRSITEKEKDQKELEQAREKEKAVKKANILKFSGRHSRFGGTYVIQNMKSISEQNVIYHKSLAVAQTFSYDEGKVPKKMAKNRVTVKGDEGIRRSTLSMRLILKEFCVQFLINAYNPLMRAVKEALTRKTTQENDETYYLWAMRYFMEFCRLHCKRVDLVGETISMSAFHYIYTQLGSYYENIRLIKDVTEARVWGKRTHVALKAYQELLKTLDFMNKSNDEQLRQSAKVIQSNVFYMFEYRDIFVLLLKNFKEAKCSRSFLRDLVESTHIFLKMLEAFSKSSKLVVQKKKAKRKKKARMQRQNTGEMRVELTEEQLLELWEGQAANEIPNFLEARPQLPEGLSPFDAASDVSVDEQRTETMFKVQQLLRDMKFSDAVALFRSAREVWPERDQFGSDSMTQDEELAALREVFMANLPRPAQQEVNGANEVETADISEEEEMNEVEEEELQEIEKCETEFNFLQFVGDFAHPDIVKNYATLLAEFSANSDLVNHSIVKMLHRLSHDLGFVGMLFQASIFKTFSNLLHGSLAKLPRFKELCKFACYVIGQFTAIAQVNKKVFVDLMFWKNKNEAIAITSNYDFQSKSSAKVSWTEHDEQELLSLFEKYRDIQDPEKDTIDLIMTELTSSHTRLQVLRELKRQEVITSVKDIRKPKASTRRPMWTDEELDELKQLFEDHKNSKNPLSDIMKVYSGSKGRSAVMNKIMELGLVDDKSQLFRKRKPDGTAGRKGRSQHSNESEDESSQSGEDSSQSGEGSSQSGDDNCELDQSNDKEQPLVSVSELAKKVIDGGYRGQLSWLQRGLRNTAEDREEGICVPTPLVAVTEENETAMEDERFLSFLRSLGITPPSNEQEVFWRIPANYSAEDLRKIANSLELTESDELTGAQEISSIVARVSPISASSGGAPGRREKKEKDKKKKKKSKRKEKVDRRSRPDTEDGLDTTFVPVIPRLAKDSDTSDSGLDSEIEAREQKAIWLEKHGKNTKRMTSDERRDALKRMLERKKEKIVRSSRMNTLSKDTKTSEAIMTPQGHDDTKLKKLKHSPRERQMLPAKKERDSESDTSSLSSLSDDQSLVTEQDDQSQPVTTGIAASSPLRSAAGSASVKTRKRFLDSDSSDSETRTLSVNSEKSVKSKPEEKRILKRVRMLASDDDDDDEKDVDENGIDEGEAESSQQEETFKLHFSSSEDEQEQEERKDATQNQKESFKKDTADSFPATLLTQSLDSDEEDDHVPLRAALKRKRVIDDSDED